MIVCFLGEKNDSWRVLFVFVCLFVTCFETMPTCVLTFISNPACKVLFRIVSSKRQGEMVSNSIQNFSLT